MIPRLGPVHLHGTDEHEIGIDLADRVKALARRRCVEGEMAEEAFRGAWQGVLGAGPAGSRAARRV